MSESVHLNATSSTEAGQGIGMDNVLYSEAISFGSRGSNKLGDW